MITQCSSRNRKKPMCVQIKMQINSGFKTKKFICLIILLFQSSKQAENIFVFLLLCSWYFGKIRSLLFPIFSQCSLFVVTHNRFIFEKYSLFQFVLHLFRRLEVVALFSFLFLLFSARLSFLHSFSFCQVGYSLLTSFSNAFSVKLPQFSHAPSMVLSFSRTASLLPHVFS